MIRKKNIIRTKYQCRGFFREVVVGKKISWNMDHKQGVHFITTSPHKPDRVLYNVTFDPTEGDFLFDFKAAWCSMKIVVLFSILSDLNRFIVKNEGGWVIFLWFYFASFSSQPEGWRSIPTTTLLGGSFDQLWHRWVKTIIKKNSFEHRKKCYNLKENLL